MHINISPAHNDLKDEAGDLATEAGPSIGVADLLVAYLEQIGVEYVFGVPGGAIEPIYNALARSQRRGGLRPIVARHEAGAAFMADGYTRETGKLGVCCATSGPGATNLITGVATAYDNGIPMLVLTGQPSLPTFGKRALQESACTGINTLGMFQHCTRYNSMISHPEQVEAKLVAALMRATRVPRGPSHLTIPLDILKSQVPLSKPSYDLSTLLQPSSMVDEDAMEQLYELILKARRMVLLIGGWCGESIGSILQFATLQGAPFVTTPDGKGFVNPRHPLFRGVFGFAGHAAANAVLSDKSVDLVLAIGSSMGEWTSGGWSESLLNDRLVHIDESDDHLSRSPMAKLHVRGRILTIFNRLLYKLRAQVVISDNTSELYHQPCTPQPGDWNMDSVLAQPTQCMSDAGSITPQWLMYELSRRLPVSTRFLADAGNSVAWATHYLHPRDRRVNERRIGSGRKITPGRRQAGGGWLRVTMDFAPMGWAIGGAVGTAAGNPNVPVVCITGDGSMLMNGQEISTAVAEGLTVIYVVLNDAALGMVKHGQRLAGAEQIAFELPVTDFAAMARAMGADAYTVRSPQDFDALDIDAICSRKGPTLLDVHIDGEQVPPMNLRMRVLSTSR